jgi:hypothetical protein
VHLVDYLDKADSGKPVSLVVRKGGETGSVRTYELIPVEKEIINGEGVMQKTKLLGFRPRMKMTKVYGNPFSWSYAKIGSTLEFFFKPLDQKDGSVLRNVSGPEPEPFFIKTDLRITGLNRILILFAFLNLFFLAKAPVDLYRVASSRSGVLF